MLNSINRRNIINILGITSFGMINTKVLSKTSNSKTFVLVHGTWHGGWVWRDVRNYIHSQGHKVFSPSLTGCGDRKHLMNSSISLKTHIDDICNIIQYEELDDIILVGHSFSGIVITGVADRLKNKINNIVFLDALVPTKERMSAVPKQPNGEYSEYWNKRKEKFIDGYQMDFFSEYPIKMLVPEENIEQIKWLKKHITRHPSSSWTDKLELKNNGWKGLKRTYIHCIGQKFSQTSDNMIGPARNGKDWNFIQVPWSRNAMVTHPKELSDLLISL